MIPNILNTSKTTPELTRRGFLKAGTALLGTAFASPVLAALAPQGERTLSFYNTHTGESLKSVYWAEGQYQSDGLSEIFHVLRDHRTGDEHPMSTQLLDLLHDLSRMLETGQQFHVISGYRSPKTNAMLANHSNGVAKRSLHMDGLAIDIRVPGRQLADVRKAAIALQGGGVGYYPASDFVHVDVGRVRTW